MYFWVFLAIVYTIYSLIIYLTPCPLTGKGEGERGLHLRNVYLMLVSWFFYYKTSGIFLALLVALTVINWLFGLLLGRLQSSLAPRWGKGGLKAGLGAGVLIDLAALFYFKYAYFGVDVFNTIFGTNHTIAEKIILPVGISFYTFQVISYIADIYQGKVKPVRNLLDFGFYVAFFPQLVAGPIVRASEFLPQLYKPFFLGRRQFGIAVFWILNGLLKKIILSDYLAVNFVDRVFQSPLLFSGFENFMALLVYSMQVYADFSGYTDIAIGVAMLFGFYLPKNFDSPYKSQNPQEFWRRWHCSLSRWLKQYVYIPLGGNRTILGIKCPKLLAGNWNSFLTMLIGGLWHGASWNFVIWGGLNGIGMIINKIWRAIKESLGISQWVKRHVWIDKIDTGVSVVITFLFISFTRLFFRSSSNLDPATANEEAWDTARNMMGQITGAWHNDVILPFLWEYRYVVVLFALGMVIHWLPAKFKQWYRLNFAMMPIWLIGLAVILCVAIVYQFITADMQPFIYFQF